MMAPMLALFAIVAAAAFVFPYLLILAIIAAYVVHMPFAARSQRWAAAHPEAWNDRLAPAPGRPPRHPPRPSIRTADRRPGWVLRKPGDRTR